MIAVLLIDHRRSASTHHEDTNADLPGPSTNVSVAHGT